MSARVEAVGRAAARRPHRDPVPAERQAEAAEPARSDRSTRARRAVVGLLVALVVATSTTVWVGTGDPVLTLLPLGAVVAAWAALRAPLHAVGSSFFFLAILADNPKEHPALGDWMPPTYPLSLALYENLNTLTGVASLRFAVVDLLVPLGLVVAALRSRGAAGVVGVPRPIHVALGVALAAIVWLEASGMARGGDFASSLWQLRQIVWLPAITWFFVATIRGRRDLGSLFALVVLVCAIKVAQGAYFYWAVCVPRGVHPDYVATHSDSVLFTTAIAGAIAMSVESATRQRLVLSVLVAGLVGLGVVLNGRRLAYVGLAGAVVVMTVLAPSGAAWLRRGVAWGALPAAAYLALGWESRSFLFSPARKIASLFSSTDRSAGSRDIENYNLLLGWRKNPVFGSGFGFAYDEVSKADSIERFFPMFRFMGHNSVLWLISVGGLVGFGAFWSVLVVAAYFAARAHRHARTADQRSAALTALCVVVAFVVQAYGDMGLQSWMGVVMLAMAIAVAGKLAVESGAWPAPAGGRA